MGFFYISEDTTTDRYDMRRFIEWSDDRYIMNNSYFIQELKKLAIAGTYQCEGERPEVIAHKIYNDKQFWWIILSYNDITDMTDGSLAQGKVITYPSLTDIETLMFSLNSLKRAMES